MSAGVTGGASSTDEMLPAPAAASVLPTRRYPLPDPNHPEATPAVPVTHRVAVRAGVLTHWLSNLLTAVAVVAFLGLAVGPHLFGYRTMTMLTGSMVPVINPGDVVVDTEIPVQRLDVGDVITYQIPVQDHRVVSHRVLSIRSLPGGAVVVQTKGDANPAPDPWQAVVTGGKVWQVRAVVPKIGLVIRALRKPDRERALRFGGISATVLFGLLAIWNKDNDRKGIRKPTRKLPGWPRPVGVRPARSEPDPVGEWVGHLLGETVPEPARPAVPSPRRVSSWQSLNRRQPGGFEVRSGYRSGTRR